MPRKEIEREFLNGYLDGMQDAVECGFLFGSVAKGYYKPHHDIDVFLIFKEANDNAQTVAKNRYFSLHEKFRASPDTQYPGEFYTRSQIERYVDEPINLDLDWRLYGEQMLDRLFVLEVLAGEKTAIFGDGRFLSEMKTKSESLLREWRQHFNNQMLGMSDYDVLKSVIFKKLSSSQKT
ncbi:MAG: nucleotidyltransferase domain-containing protein [Micavibrio sp.]|nr:nucleotidyltransferase domain-containing protein [Micavibrio sp.]